MAGFVVIIRFIILFVSSCYDENCLVFPNQVLSCEKESKSISFALDIMADFIITVQGVLIFRHFFLSCSRCVEASSMASLGMLDLVND